MQDLTDSKQSCSDASVATETAYIARFRLSIPSGDNAGKYLKLKEIPSSPSWYGQFYLVDAAADATPLVMIGQNVYAQTSSEGYRVVRVPTGVSGNGVLTVIGDVWPTWFGSGTFIPAPCSVSNGNQLRCTLPVLPATNSFYYYNYSPGSYAVTLRQTGSSTDSGNYFPYLSIEAIDLV